MKDQGRIARAVSVVLLAVVATLVGYFWITERGGDPDQFWHLATGRWIFEHGSVPSTDVFSWWGMENGRAWVPHEWLYGLWAYGWYALGGFTLLAWVTAALEGVLAALFYALGRARGLSFVWSLALAAVGILGSAIFVVPRPQSMTFCLMVLLMLLLEKERWWWALLVIVVGVNLHGLVWPLYVGIYALYAFPKRLPMIGAAFAVTLANPHPLQVATLAFTGISSSTTARISEFQPTKLWQRPWDLAVYVGVALGTRGAKIPWKEGVFAIAVMLLGLAAVRHVVWMYVIVLPLMLPYAAPVIEGALARLAAAAKERFGAVRPGASSDPDAEIAVAEGDAGERRMDPSIVAAGALAVAAVVLAFAVVPIPWEPTVGYPVQLVEYLKDKGYERAFTDFPDGGFLIWSGYAPLLDGRGDPFAPQPGSNVDLMAAYFDVVGGTVSPRAFLDEWKIRYVMVRRTFPALITMQADPAFRGLVSTKTHVLLEYDPESVAAPPASESATPSPEPWVEPQGAP